MNASGQLTVTLPSLAPRKRGAHHGAEAAPSAGAAGGGEGSEGFRVSWPLAEVREAFRGSGTGVLPSGAGGTQVCQPNEGVIHALEKLAAECDPHYRKAVAPAAFLAAAIFAPLLTAKDSETELPGLWVGITEATLPVAAGLGSSAAVSVAAAAALLDVYLRWTGSGDLASYSKEAQGKSAGGGRGGGDGQAAGAGSSVPTELPAAVPTEHGLDLVNAWAYSSEMLFHGSPSGLDNTVAT